MASTFDLYNRQLHPPELQRIKELAQGDAEKELRLTAAGCALVHCSAQLDEKHPDYKVWQSLEKAGNDPALAEERRVLQGQKDLFIYGDYWDGAKDWADRENIGTRALGAVQWVGGSAQAVLAGASCAAGGMGCAAAPYLVATGYDAAQAGWKTLKSGEAHATQGSLVLQSLGLSPEAAELLYGATQLAPVAVEAYLTGRVMNQVGVKVQETITGNAAKIETQLAGRTNKLDIEIPGRVQSRINLSNEGMSHLKLRHLSEKENASKFLINEKEIVHLLQSGKVIEAPIYRVIKNAKSTSYVREVDTGNIIGFDKFAGSRTSILTVITDKYGNLLTAFPGRMK